ncbi:MAG: TIGR02206 family membrane protein [Polyangiaceae bacterium]
MTRWDTPHWIAIGLTIGLGIGSGLSLRRSDPSARVGALRALALALVLSGTAVVVADRLRGVPWHSAAPLHLCDLSVFLAAAAALRPREGLVATAYFWCLAGAFPAMLWPDLAYDFPHHRFVLYFVQHGLLVVAALTFALALPFRAPFRRALHAWLAMNACALVVAGINVRFGFNYMYLSRPPGAGSPLDVFGPWPGYIVGGELVAVALFAVLALPVWWWAKREAVCD